MRSHLKAAFMLITFAVMTVGATGCRSQPKPRPAPPPPTPAAQMLSKPAIDLTRGGAGFPLDTNTPPATIEALVASLKSAYAARLTDSNNIRINAAGTSPDAIETLEINLSGSSVSPKFAPKGQPKTVKAQPYANVKLLRYVAEPLNYQNHAASMVLEADNAELALVPGDDQKLGLSLVDCREGRAQIRIGVNDLREGLVAGARLKATAAFAITGIEMALRSNSERSVEAEVAVKARVLLIPASFRLTGRADVDSNFNVHFTNLAAKGHDPSGALIAGVVQGKLDKLNNKIAPLLKLPGDRIRVTDLKLSVDQSITIDVKLAGSKQ